MLARYDDVGPVLRERLGRGAHSGGAGDERMHFPAAGRVGERARGSDGVEGDLSQRVGARFGKYQDVGHQRILASVCRRRTSSGTAAAPSPMMRPAGRSGGSSIDFTTTRASPSCAGFVSSGFFFAAMIPLSDG